MIVGCLIYLFAVLLNKVSLEYTVKSAVGVSAVLNCSYTADTNKVDKVDWVYNHTYIVYAFSPSSQPFNEKFQTIPQDFPNGNYALKIKKVEITDEGVYTCIITPADYYTNLQLVVEESHKGTKKDDPDKGNQKPSDLCTTVCVVVLVVLVLLVFVGILLFVCIKKGCVGYIRKLYASHCLRSAY